ncbi:MAG TPA: cyclophilin-like fold protein [Pyrinomonadaceae bacterium]|jgi:hypothetical protein
MKPTESGVVMGHEAVVESVGADVRTVKKGDEDYLRKAHLKAGILRSEALPTTPPGNLVIFYKDFEYSDGLVKLGTIDSGVEPLSRPGPLKVTIELVK